MAKPISDGDVYAVLLEGPPAKNAIAMIGKEDSLTEPDEEADRDALNARPSTRSNKKKDGCRRWLTCLGWPLLLTVGAACLTIVTFHLWVTWNLQQRVFALQAQVDALSALDWEELKIQLREFYELRDLNSADRDTSAGLPGLPTSADGDQEDAPYAERLSKLVNREEPSAITGKGTRAKQEETWEEDDIDLDASDEDDDDAGLILEDDDEDEQDEANPDKERKRHKRQTDLSSHTQDGVPIFDRGYGVPLNKTEGLRIYQSLLASGGVGEPRSPDVNWQQSTEAPIQPHHRQNSFWRERKEKPRHHAHHQLNKPAGSTTSPNSGDRESSFSDPTSEHVPSHNQNQRGSSVEFRHSRVKPSSGNHSGIGGGSSTGTSSTQPLTQGEVVPGSKFWATRSSPIGSLLPLATTPDERINAATAPAVSLTHQPATAGSSSAPTTSRTRHSHQPSNNNVAGDVQNVFKVTQPALVSRYSTEEAHPTIDKSSDDFQDRSRPTHSAAFSSKKRVNKKQLRDLGTTVTAVHLVADVRNNTTADSDNQVEIASRNELGLHTSWKMAGLSWDSSPTTKSPLLVKIDGATLTIKQSGLYFIYAQVHYLDEHSVNAYDVFINTEPFMRCVTSSYSETPLPKANTCYTAAATHLREGDKLFLRDIEPMRYSVLQPSKTYFGLVRLAPAGDFS